MSSRHAVFSELEQVHDPLPQAGEEVALLHIGGGLGGNIRSGDRLTGLIDELHAAGSILGLTGKAGVVLQTAGHLVQHGLQAMDLLLVQSAGQLGDALLIELVQAIVQPDRAIAELACAIIQGGHAVVQGLGAIGQLGGTVLCGVAIATCLFKLQMNGTAVSSGMGTCGFVGQIGVYTGWMNDIAAGTKTAVTGMDWAGLILISFILPAVLCPLINMFVRKLGWVKDGDMTLS